MLLISRGSHGSVVAGEGLLGARRVGIGAHQNFINLANLEIFLLALLLLALLLVFEQLAVLLK